LNDAREVLDGKFPPQNLILRQLPLLYIEFQNENGEWRDGLSFNDAWVERASSQSAWIEIKLNNQIRLSKLIADGALISTAAGSTAYARAMGASPLLVDTPALLLVGSNVMYPAYWKSALLSFDSLIEFNALNHDKRPIYGYVDGQFLGRVKTLRARVSRIAAAEVAFCPDHDMAKKIAKLQFPQESSF
jgi:NAD kinase